MQRAAFAQRHAGQAALGGVGRLADRLRHLARLAVAEAGAALLVADDHQRGEGKAPAALHHLGHAVDVDQLVDELAVALFAATAFAVSPGLSSGFMCHVQLIRLEVEAAFARGVGQRFDAPVIEIAAAVEHDVLDALFLGALGDQLADRLGRVDVGAGLGAFAQRLFERRGGGERLRPCRRR